MLRALWKFLFPTHLHAHYETVRYAFPVVFVAAFVASLAAVVSSNQSFVSIETTAQTVARDQEFYVDVKVSAHVPINAVDLQIAYPEHTVAIEGIDTGRSVITLWTEEPYARNGTIYLRGGTFRQGFVGEHTIARIRVRAREAGEAQLAVRETALVAGDGRGTPVTVSQNPSRNALKILVTGTADGVITGEAVLAVVTDANGDGQVNVGDITLFMSAWLTREHFYDFNNDGKMTFRDFSILLADSFLR
jgi:hypothetical protein